MFGCGAVQQVSFEQPLCSGHSSKGISPGNVQTLFSISQPSDRPVKASVQGGRIQQCQGITAKVSTFSERVSCFLCYS